LGITVAGLKELVRALPADAVDKVNQKITKNKDGTLKFPKNSNVNGYVNQHFIAEATKEDNLTTCERLQQQRSPHVDRANVFVSWALSTPLNTLVDALQAFLNDRKLPEGNTLFWICDYVIRQAGVKPDLKWLGNCVAWCGRTVLLLEPWQSAEPLKRTYCIKEVHHTQEARNNFDLVMSTKEQASFVKALTGDFDSIMAALTKVDVGKAECRNPEDTKAILDELGSLPGGLKHCNEVVCGLMREQMLTKGQAAVQVMQEEGKGESAEAALLMNQLGRLLDQMVRFFI
jgi:hypothetical protein